MTIPPHERRQIEDAIERLVALLDAADGDTDLEPDDEDDEHDGGEPLAFELKGSDL